MSRGVYILLAIMVKITVIVSLVGDADATRRRQRNGRPPPWPLPNAACIGNQADPGVVCLENTDTPEPSCCSGICELRGGNNVCCLPLGEPCVDANDCCSSSCFASACN